MTRITLTITLDVPEGVRVAVSDPANSAGDYVPPFADELIPFPDGVHALPGDVNVQPGFAQGAAIAQPVPFRGAAQVPGGANYCPVHHEPWKIVPAGISKKDGKPYNAFAACPVRGCNQRPPAGYAA